MRAATAFVYELADRVGSSRVELQPHLEPIRLRFALRRLTLEGSEQELAVVAEINPRDKRALKRRPVEGSDVSIEMGRYGGDSNWPGGGHHVPAQAVLRNDPNFAGRNAPAISEAIMEKYHLVHANISRAQQFLYRDFAKTNLPMTWDQVRKIETEVLVAQGVLLSVARATVNRAIAILKKQGVKILREPYR